MGTTAIAEFSRAICIVLDGCGAGAAPDADLFGDVGENEGHTLLNVWKAVNGFLAPRLDSLGYLAACGIYPPIMMTHRVEEDESLSALERSKLPPIRRLLNALLQQAVVDKAKVLNFVPTASGLKVTAVVDDTDVELMRIPMNLSEPILLRLRGLAEVGETENEGNFEFSASGFLFEAHLRFENLSIGDAASVAIIEQRVLDGQHSLMSEDEPDTREHDPRSILEIKRLAAVKKMHGQSPTRKTVVPQSRAFGRMREISLGKDTITGHWEMMGIRLENAFPTYPKGFPIPLIKEFEKRIGKQTIGNEPASGTEIIKRLGQMHVDTGCPIVYTSADSVFQIACHESVIPIEELYEMCRIARELLVEPNNVGRVIARPFTGDQEHGFARTERRKDFPITPPPNLIDKINEKYGPVFGIGVIPEVFAGRGFREVRRTQDNAQHFEMLKVALESDAKFIWANFEDFDMLYGHRNDPQGFAKALEQFDIYLGQIMEMLKDDDLLLLTADHGNDPTTPSTDHSREYVPLAIWSKNLEKTVSLGDLEGMWCLGATVADALGIEWDKGESQIPKIYGATR